MSGATDEEQATGIMKDETAVYTADEGKTQPGMVVVSGDEYVQHDAPKRRAHVCCGCCCDTRKAVFAINIVNLCLYGIGVVSVSWLAITKAKGQVDDDAVQNTLNEIDGAKIGIALSMMIAGMICNGITIYGASSFNKIAILVGIIWYVFEFVKSIAFFDFVGAIMSALFCYPHVVFYREIKSGIMSRDSYPNEKHCCECCG